MKPGRVEPKSYETLTKQQRKVFNFIKEHRGCTTSDIQRATGIECPSARITEMRSKGVKIVSIGKRKYEGSRAFERYAIEDAQPTMQTEWRFDATRNVMVEVQLPLTS